MPASFRVVDDGSGKSVGNGDGIIQKGEAIDLILSVKNAGKKTAVGITAELGLPEESGLQVFGKHQKDLGDLTVGSTKEARFNIAVKRFTRLTELPIRLVVRERSSSLAKIIEQKLPFQARIARPIEALTPKDMYVKGEQVELLSGAGPSSEPSRLRYPWHSLSRHRPLRRLLPGET